MSSQIAANKHSIGGCHMGASVHGDKLMGQKRSPSGKTGAIVSSDCAVHHFLFSVTGADSHALFGILGRPTGQKHVTAPAGPSA